MQNKKNDLSVLFHSMTDNSPDDGCFPARWEDFLLFLNTSEHLHLQYNNILICAL